MNAKPLKYEPPAMHVKFKAKLKHKTEVKERVRAKLSWALVIK